MQDLRCDHDLPMIGFKETVSFEFNSKMYSIERNYLDQYYNKTRHIIKFENSRIKEDIRYRTENKNEFLN